MRQAIGDLVVVALVGGEDVGGHGGVGRLVEKAGLDEKAPSGARNQSLVPQVAQKARVAPPGVVKVWMWAAPVQRVSDSAMSKLAA